VRLVGWFEVHGRDLPWREEPRDPYRVLVSEIMLQQTQVDRVVPRYRRFLARFPDVIALASATVEAVLEEWSGLGYYRRARNLHAAARVIVDAGGRLPATAVELRRLPGVGEYTAAAVASLAFGEPVPVLDGNVLRVGARFLALDVPARSARGRRLVAGWVGELMKDAPPGRVNEALMELGATVCTFSTPACSRCPLAGECRGRTSGNPERWPERRRVREPERVTWTAAMVFDGSGRLLLRRIDGGPILRGLWLPPLARLDPGDDPVRLAACLLEGKVVVEEGVRAVPVRHAIAHRRIEVHPILFPSPAEAQPPDHCWVDPGAPGVPTSSLLGKLVDAAAAVCGPRFVAGID